VNKDNLDILPAEQEPLVSFVGVQVVNAFCLFLCFTCKFVLSYSDCPLSEIYPRNFEKSNRLIYQNSLNTMGITSRIPDVTSVYKWGSYCL